jgi:hypothetical protein
MSNRIAPMTGAALLIFFAMVGSMAFAQKGPAAAPVPTLRATAVAPTPPPPAPTPGGPSINGISVGAPTSVVDAKCREAGVKCVKGARRFKSMSVDRVKIDFTTGDFAKVFVTSKGGTVLGVRGHYRTQDKDRVTKLQKAQASAGTQKRGALTWGAPNGVVTSIDNQGQSLQYVDTKQASAQGVAVTTQAFLAPAPKAVESIRPVLTASVLSGGGATRTPAANGAVGHLGDMQLEQTPTPQVTNTLKIPVSIKLGELRCYDENDLTSLFWGDDPYLNITGTHTSHSFPRPWVTQKAYSDVESGGHLNVNLTIFPEGDQRRFVTFGEAVGVQFTLLEGDLGTNDEIDFAYPIVEYPFAFANQGKTLDYQEILEGDGAVYTLKYQVVIGTGTPDPSANTNPFRYRNVDPKIYAGNFQGSIGDGVGEANLSFLASRDPAYPNGVLYGSFKEGATVLTVRTVRLLGDAIEMYVKYPSGNPGHFVGYLIGDGSDRRLAGTLTRDGTTRGVSLMKK